MAKQIIIFHLYICLSASAYSQTIAGKIKLSPHWQPLLYIIRIDDIGLQPPTLMDSIQLAKDGNFSYSFEHYTPEGILYKISIPPIGGNYRTVIDGTQDNYFLFTTEEKESIEINADADSLFYSVKINAGKVNKELLNIRDNKKYLFNITRLLEDSASRYPDLKSELDSQLASSWFSFPKKFSLDVQHMLDTTNNDAVLFAGIYYLHQANFGITDSDLLRKYINKVSNRESILAERIYQLAHDDELVRKGKQIPNLLLKDFSGKRINLYDYTKEITVIDFWASWCGPCRQANTVDLPLFLEKYIEGNDRISFLTVSIDDDESKWRKAVDQDHLLGDKLFDSTAALKELLSVKEIPLYVVMDHNDKIIFEAVSFFQLIDFFENGSVLLPRN